MLAFPTLGHCTKLLTIIKAIAVTSAKIGGVSDYTDRHSGLHQGLSYSTTLLSLTLILLVDHMFNYHAIYEHNSW